MTVSPPEPREMAIYSLSLWPWSFFKVGVPPSSHMINPSDVNLSHTSTIGRHVNGENESEHNVANSTWCMKVKC